MKTCVYHLQVLEVYNGNTLLGSVTQEWSLWRPTFSVRDASGNPVLVIKGPLLRCCIEVAFKVSRETPRIMEFSFLKAEMKIVLRSVEVSLYNQPFTECSAGKIFG